MEVIGVDLIKNGKLKDKFVGALLGTAVGDALGMPLEGMSAREIEDKYGYVEDMLDGRLTKGHYTDDTQLMIGVAESLIESGGFDGGNMASAFLANFEAYRGYGPGTIQIMKRLLDGQNWSEAAEHLYGGGSYGNGSAMRIAPVGVLYNSKPELLINTAEETSRITHTHELGIEGAILQAYGIGLAVNAQPERPAEPDTSEFINQLDNLSCLSDFKVKLASIRDFLSMDDEPTKERLISELGVSIRIHRSVPMAIYCFLKMKHSFKDAVVYAVNMGGDTDTIGAMTGALAGALHGAEEIPAEWLDTLENGTKGRDYIIELGEKLYKLYTEL